MLDWDLTELNAGSGGVTGDSTWNGGAGCGIAGQVYARQAAVRCMPSPHKTEHVKLLFSFCYQRAAVSASC